jgi:N6-adenosine-specific RNA methylase IME4/ParB-like chromosome segregation protein Spo0J
MAKNQKIGLSGIAVQPDRMRQLRPEVVDEIAESIKERGLLQPIIVRPRKGSGYFLVAGRHRLAAVKKLKHEDIACVVLDGLSADQALLAEIDENLVRGDLTPAETAAHHAERKRLYEKLHPETKRGSAGGRAKAAKTKKGAKSQNETQQPGYTKDVVKKTGKSRATVAREVARAKDIDPQALKDLTGTCLDKRDELDAMAKLPVGEQRKLAKRAKAREKVSAKVQVKKLRRAEREVKLAKKIATASATATAAGAAPKYGVIYADPAWKFKVHSEAGMDRAADNHYPTQTIEKIMRLDVASIAAQDSVLFMWVTVPFLDRGIDVLRKWGFTYISSVAWVKDKTGTGYWFRGEHEVLLVGKQGRPPAPAPGDNSASVLEAPVGEHSVKPVEVAEMIERLYPSVPKIELYCRGDPRPGWRGWGNECTDADQLVLSDDDWGGPVPNNEAGPFSPEEQERLNAPETKVTETKAPAPALEWHGPGVCGNYSACIDRGGYTITLEGDSLQVSYDNLSNDDPTIIVATIPVTAKHTKNATPAKSAKVAADLAKARAIAEADWAKRRTAELVPAAIDAPATDATEAVEVQEAAE